MKAENVTKAAPLVAALASLPKVSRALSDKPGKYHDCTWLEMQAAEMADGESQGCSHWLDLPPEIGRKVLAATKQILEAELRKLGVRA